MKAKFIGDPREPKPVIPDEITLFGVTFEKGKFADVPDKFAAKFAGNDHFETEGKAPKAEEAPAVAVISPVVLPEDPTVKK